MTPEEFEDEMKAIIEEGKTHIRSIWKLCIVVWTILCVRFLRNLDTKMVFAFLKKHQNGIRNKYIFYNRT